jgi:rhomboid protease GluP
MDLIPTPVAIFHAPSRKKCLEQGLVLQAAGIPFEIHQVSGGFSVLVRPEYAGPAYEQLQGYREENTGWPPKYEPPPLVSLGVGAAIAYAVILTVMYPIGRYGAFGANFWASGKMHAGGVMHGEWWRTITSLTLHADVSHLAGNVVFGSAFAVLASHTMGAGLAWFCIVLSGSIGNLVNAAIQAPGHTAIGASTAVFGALGVLSAYEWMRRHALANPPMRRFAPLLGGALLLGFLGMTGERTDVMAHVTGLFAGIAIGVITGRTKLPEHLSDGAQSILGAMAVAIVVVGWSAALAFA